MTRKVSENVILISGCINYLILKISNVILICIKKVKLYILFQTMGEHLLKRSAMQSFKIELLINNCYELTYGDILIDWLIDWLALNETFSSISAISWRKQVLYNKFYNYSTIWYKLDLCIKNDKRKIRDKNIVYKSVV